MSTSLLCKYFTSYLSQQDISQQDILSNIQELPGHITA
jgi:hypothetical protein